MNNNRFARQILMFGEEGQKKIEAQKVAVVGAGGIGSQVCQSLAYLGVRKFTVIDDDILDDTNMNREAGGYPPDVGRPKVDVIRDHVQKINPDADVLPMPINLRTRSAMEAVIESSVVFGCVDHDGPRLVLSELVSAYAVPLIDVATEIFPEADNQPFEFGGRVVVAKPGEFCLFCADQIDRDLAKEELESPEVRAVLQKHGYGLGSDDPSPGVFALNGVLANVAVTEFMMLTTGIREPVRHVTYKGTRGVMLERTNGKKDDCYTCGSVGKREMANVWRYLLPKP